MPSGRPNRDLIRLFPSARRRWSRRAQPLFALLELRNRRDAYVRRRWRGPDGFLNVHRTEIIALAARYRLPTVYPWRFFAELGGLISYGNEQRDSFRLAATYVDRILKGEKPGELPAQAPVKFELIINMKTAKALGLNVPLQLQQLADTIIE